MALADLTFKLYNDAALTQLFGGTLSLVHESDLSDNPQDSVLYFGSPSTDVQLQAVSNPGVDNITIAPLNTLPAWVASTAQIIGYDVQPTVSNDRKYVVETAGTSAATEPSWPIGIGSTVLDGTILWRCVSKTHEPAEFKLATTLLGLDSAVAGAALIMGTTLLSTSANAVPVHIRTVNTVTTPSANDYISLNINNVTETAV